MKQPTQEETSTADLAALAAVAQGRPAQVVLPSEIEDPARKARIEELKAKYQAGQLALDASAIAAKLIDSHLQAKEPG